MNHANVRRTRKAAGLIIGLAAAMFVRAAAADDLFQGAMLAETTRLEAPTAEAKPAAKLKPAAEPKPAVKQENVTVEPVDADELPESTEVKSLRDISLDINVAGERPSDVAAPGASDEALVGNDLQRGFPDTVYFWQASNMVHRPLYFEQKYVERYGANFGALQPVASGVQFYGDVALLPVKMLRHPPCECRYSLGYERPGDVGVRCPRH